MRRGCGFGPVRLQHDNTTAEVGDEGENETNGLRCRRRYTRVVNECDAVSRGRYVVRPKLSRGRIMKGEHVGQRIGKCEVLKTMRCGWKK